MGYWGVLGGDRGGEGVGELADLFVQFVHSLRVLVVVEVFIDELVGVAGELLAAGGGLVMSGGHRGRHLGSGRLATAE